MVMGQRRKEAPPSPAMIELRHMCDAMVRASAYQAERRARAEQKKGKNMAMLGHRASQSMVSRIV
jgi:hypothetical protein